MTPSQSIGKRAVVLGALAMSLSPATATAQSLSDQLSTLLTAQAPTSVLVPDLPAAEATRDTVARLLSIELTSLPLASSAGGFAYRWNPTLGVVERASQGFGPFFTERTLQNGRGHVSLGLSYQQSDFGSLQGADLTDGTFPSNAARTAGSTQPFSVDTLSLDIDSNTTTVFGSYGVTDRLAVGASLPFVRVRFNGTRRRSEAGVSSLQATQAGSSSGVGDAALSVRYRVAGDGARGFSLGSDLRLPTGREDDLLGSGRVGARFLSVGSWEEGPLAVSVNGGLGVGGASRQINWAMATTLAVHPRATLVGEVLGFRLSDLRYVEDVYQPHPLMPGVETMRWLDADRVVVSTVLVTGAKWNLGESWLLNTSVLIRVSDGGLSGKVTPSISFGYDFER